MSKFSQLQNQAGNQNLADEWAHFARVDAQHREIITLLESTAEEEREILKKASAGRRLTLIPFAFTGESKKLAEEGRNAERELEHVRQRLAEELKTLDDNEQRLHTTLHTWLIAHDPVYRKSGDITRRLREICDDITAITGLLLDLRSRYGAALCELAVSFDHHLHELSDTALVAFNGLVHAHGKLAETQSRFSQKIADLNTVIDGTLYRELKLPPYQAVPAIEFRKGMSYPKLHENLEAGLQHVAETLDRLNEDYGAAQPTSALLDTILHRYRDNLWKQYLAELNSDTRESLAG